MLKWVPWVAWLAAWHHGEDLEAGDVTGYVVVLSPMELAFRGHSLPQLTNTGAHLYGQLRTWSDVAHPLADLAHPDVQACRGAHQLSASLHHTGNVTAAKKRCQQTFSSYYRAQARH